jgi:uncharacterized Zn-finger protein
MPAGNVTLAEKQCHNEVSHDPTYKQLNPPPQFTSPPNACGKNVSVLPMLHTMPVPLDKSVVQKLQVAKHALGDPLVVEQIANPDIPPSAHIQEQVPALPKHTVTCDGPAQPLKHKVWLPIEQPTTPLTKELVVTLIVLLE